MIQFLRGNKSQLEASQTIFGDGQPIFEKDTGQLKVGNGIDVFSSLPYVGNFFKEHNQYIDITPNFRICTGIYSSSYLYIVDTELVNTEIGMLGVLDNPSRYTYDFSKFPHILDSVIYIDIKYTSGLRYPVDIQIDNDSKQFSVVAWGIPDSESSIKFRYTIFTTKSSS